MKNTTQRAAQITLSAFLLSAFCFPDFGRAQFATPIDTNTPSTNTYSLNYQAWSPGLFTNVVISLLNTQYVVTGDAPSVIARKVNDGFTNTWLWSIGQSNFVVGLSNRVTATNAALSAILFPLATNFFTLSNTVAAGGGGGSGLTNGSRMAFDWHGGSNNIVSDGLGDQTNSGSLTVNGTIQTERVLLGAGGGLRYFNNQTYFLSMATNCSLMIGDDGNFSLNSPSSTLALDPVGGFVFLGTGGLMMDDGGNFLCYDTTASLDFGAITTDGSGNLTCTSLTQTSDVNAKTNIVALNDLAVLARLASVPVYRWQFKPYASTNYFTNQSGIVRARVRQHPISPVHVGPMAQDWAGKFGGATNTGISVVDMQGFLLAGIQALAARQGVITNATGAGFRLLVNAQTNGFVFVPQ